MNTMHEKILLFGLVALVLLILRPRLREGLAPTATIKAPPYDQAEKDRIVALVPGQLEKSKQLMREFTRDSGGTFTDTDLDFMAKDVLVRAVDQFYRDVYENRIDPVTEDIIASTVAEKTSRGVPPEGVEPAKTLFTQLLKTYFMTGASATTTTTSTIRAPNTNAAMGESMYDQAETDRIASLVPGLVGETAQLLGKPEQDAKKFLADTVGRFHAFVYTPKSGSVTDADIATFVTAGAPPPGTPDTIVQSLASINTRILKAYFMTGASASTTTTSPSLQQPDSYSQLNATYRTKVADYERMVQQSLQTNDATTLPTIRALNEEITALLEKMLKSLDPLRSDTATTQKQREDLAKTLARIQSDYAGLKESTDTMTRLRRIRNADTGEIGQRQLNFYLLLLAITSIGLLVIVVSRSSSTV